jgi:hypothetical protein
MVLTAPDDTGLDATASVHRGTAHARTGGCRYGTTAYAKAFWNGFDPSRVGDDLHCPPQPVSHALEGQTVSIRASVVVGGLGVIGVIWGRWLNAHDD